MSVRAVLFVLFALAASAQSLRCDLAGYKPLPGLTTEIAGADLRVAWSGESNRNLRAVFAIRDAHPIVRELAIQGPSGWITLARDLTPEFDVVSGRRRVSNQQLNPLKALNIPMTPE